MLTPAEENCKVLLKYRDPISQKEKEKVGLQQIPKDLISLNSQLTACNFC